MTGLTKPDRLLNPMDRAAGILFGLIMVLTFTCSISIANTDRTKIRHLLIGALGCNLAWGIVDATMYLVGVAAQNKRNKTIFDAVQNASETENARKQIADALPPVVALVMETEELEQIRNKLVNLPASTSYVRLTSKDIKKAIALFLLIFISTLPVAVPFVVIHNIKLALRVSNLVAVVLMFLCGWTVAVYVGFNKWIMSFAIVLIGIVLVVITIALGG